MEERTMNLVILERDSVGTDIDVSCFEQFGLVTSYANTTAEQVAQRVKESDIIISNKAPMNEHTLADAPNIKLICLLATGYDCVDLSYCKSRGIKVTNVINYCTCAVAQHTILLALMLSEKIAFYDNYVKSGAYSAQDRFSNFDRAFHDLDNKTWGIIGMGTIGQKVAKLASAFGCKVIFYSTSGKSTCTEYPKVDLNTLLHTSDIVSLHCPLTDRTNNLIDKNAFSKMKPTAVLINVARGPVVNTQALYEALLTEKIMAAGLDVLDKEPMDPFNPLRQIQDSTKLIITPHMSWASVESRTRLILEVAKNIQAFIDGIDRNVINS